MKMKSIDREIFAVIAITIIAVALAFILPPDWVLGRILALPLVLVLPGYVLTIALFPGRKIGVSQRLVFSLALSIVIVILGGLVLNLMPFGLQAGSWAVLLGGITLGTCAVAIVRRWGQGIATSGWLRPGYSGLNVRQGLLLGLSALIVCGAVAVSIIGAQRQPYPGFTQLWMLSAGETNLMKTVRLGVSNMESTTMKYRLTVNVDGKEVEEWPSLDLNPNEKWETTILLPQTGHAGSAKIEADLYRADAPTKIYHHVMLWLST